ncbi:hypothetical protein CMI37_23000 [Candidatus Pacearchaeota archaeon]|nr:hypothetical protein [Candidatus Pacearchaeota archaeon]|tara:strand:- start:1585 stop:2022 length:438 start_codon:yes stop_codon:yes gene_type:complete
MNDAEPQNTPNSSLSERFNIGVASVQRINYILNIVHECSSYAMEGHLESFFQWKHWLSRLLMETLILLKEDEVEKIKTIKKEINKDLLSMNNKLKAQEKNNRIFVDTYKISCNLEEWEMIIRESDKIEVLLFPKDEDPAKAITKR